MSNLDLEAPVTEPADGANGANEANESSPTSSALEARLTRLDAIVAALESDGLELEQALALFEEGVGHLRAAEQVIRAAELRIEQLLEGPTGEPTLVPGGRPAGA
jgi:exodeoxyribonuclease VII small subunit